MSHKFAWLVAATVVAMVWFDVTRSLRARRRRAQPTEELVRWEGEGGNVSGA
jgi:hypothetical protein